MSHERYFALTGVSCPICGGKELMSFVSAGSTHFVKCTSSLVGSNVACKEWAVGISQKEAMERALTALVQKVDPTLKGPKLTVVVKSLLATLVEQVDVGRGVTS